MDGLIAYYVFANFVAGSYGVNAISPGCMHYGVVGSTPEDDCARVPHLRTTGEVQPHLAEAAFYPYVVVLEKRHTPLHFTEAPRRGSVWQPPYSEFVAKFTNYEELE